jgi:hypothetical protein
MWDVNTSVPFYSLVVFGNLHVKYRNHLSLAYLEFVIIVFASIDYAGCSISHIECFLNFVECLLNYVESSLNHYESSLNPVECSLNHVECSLNHVECSLFQAARLEDAMFEEDVNRRLNASLPFKVAYSINSTNSTNSTHRMFPEYSRTEYSLNIPKCSLNIPCC